MKTRDLLIALSAANLCFLKVWSEILIYRRSDTYLMRLPPTPGRIAAAMLNVLLVAAVLSLACMAGRRFGAGHLPKTFKRIFLVFLIIPLNAARSAFADYVPMLQPKSPLFDLIGRAGTVVVLFALAGLALALVIRYPESFSRGASAILLILSPFVLFTFARGTMEALTYAPSTFADKELATRCDAARRQPQARVLWLIFDEMDQRLAFIDRDRSVQLPEFDRFRSQAFYAENAYPPGQNTLTSMPALITGKLVHAVDRSDAGELLLTFEGANQPVPWSIQENVFSGARSLTLNTALVGFFHPYCRVLHKSLTGCWWWEIENETSSKGTRFTQSLPNQIRSLFETSLMSPFGQSLAARMRVRTYHAMLERAKEVAADTGLGLVLIHFPVPHPPHVYDRATNRFTLSNSPFRGYLDSLVLADHTLGELRRSMDAAGAWDSSSILISADHAYRDSKALDGKIDHRVPFLLKLAGQNTAIVFTSPLNTILTHDLLLAILTGEITDVPGLLSWCSHRSLGEPISATRPALQARR